MEIYDNPVDVFTARFIGTPSMNIVPAQLSGGVVSLAEGGAALLAGVRPHDLLVGSEIADPCMVLTGTVTAIEPLGPETLVHFTVAGKQLIATAPAHGGVSIGATVTAKVARGQVYLFDAITQKAMGRA